MYIGIVTWRDGRGVVSKNCDRYVGVDDLVMIDLEIRDHDTNDRNDPSEP